MNYWKLKQLQEWAEQTGLIGHPLVRRFLSSPLLQDDPEWEEKITRLLQIRMSVAVPEPHPLLPTPEQAGEIGPWVSPGLVIGGKGPGEPFRDPVRSFLQHKGYFGPAGSGKTVLSLLMTVQLHRQGFPVWWFDSEDEIAPLLAQEDGVLFVDAGDLRFNIFTPPPGCDPLQYVEKVISRFRETLYFRDGSVNLARSVCRNLLEQQGSFSLGDVYRSLLRLRFKVGQRSGNYWETCTNRFPELLSALGRSIDVRRGHDLAQLLDRSVVWRLRGLSDDHLAFTMSNLLLWVENYRPVQYDWRLTTTFVFDEATRICNVKKEERADISEPFFYDFARTCRKRGIGLAVVTQTPGLLPPAVLANISTWYSFRPVDASSTRVIVNSMGLSQEQADYVKHLPEELGRVVVVRHPDHPRPFLVRVSDWPVEPAPAEVVEQAVEESREWLGSGSVAAPDEVELVLDERVTDRQEEGTAPGVPARSVPAAEPSSRPMHHFELSKGNLDYLQRIAEMPFVPVTYRDRREGISACKGDRMRRELADAGLIVLHRVNTGARGGRITLSEPTEQAYRLLEGMQVRVERPKGNGGFVHRFWQHTIHAWAVRQGYPARIEDAIDEKRVDVGVEWQEKRCAVEVVMQGLEKEMSNLEKDLREGWDQVIFCAEKQETIDRLRQMIEERYGEGLEELRKEGRMAFMRFKEFISSGENEK